MNRIVPAAVVLSVAALSCSDGGASPTVPVTDPPPVPTTIPVPASTQPVVTTLAPVATTRGPIATSAPPVTTSAPVLEVLPVIPVGEGGIQYRGSGNEQEITGPTLLAVDPAGGVHIHDPEGGRIWSFTGSDPVVIDLFAIDILAIQAMAAAPDHLVVVEIFFGPVRHRVHRLSYDGVILETVELPDGLRLEDGLSGVFTDPESAIVVEFGGGAAFAKWNERRQEFVAGPDLQLASTEYRIVPGGAELFAAFVDAELTGLGGLRYLGSSTDGSVSVLVRDAVIEVDPAFVVLTTVEWYDEAGRFLGSARVPSVDAQHTDQAPGLAVTPDGRVLALMTTPTAVEVVQLERTPERILSM